MSNAADAEISLGRPHRAAGRGGAGRTPAGLQPTATLIGRRALMVALNLSTLSLILWGVALVLGRSGWSVVDVALFVCIAMTAPWTILSFWNAVIGLMLLHLARRPAAVANPMLAEPAGDAPIAGRTAVFMTVRNEDPARAFQRLLAIRASLDATGQGEQFDLFVLSDTNDPDVAAQEVALFQHNRAALDGLGSATYRRRDDNAGFKAGNVKDFVERWGEDYDFFVPLDADSVLSGDAIVELARRAERHPKVGILQMLNIGAPATSPFARLFQFGVRHSMRVFNVGSAWWGGDCGPFWGHNAIIRMEAFKRYCALPTLRGAPPLGGPILSHDQVEAVMMRRAGYEVRVAPVEGESWEEHPVTLLDFMKREQRWCNGNMQYFQLLGMKGLGPTSRFQLMQAIMMYVGAPAWILLTVLAALKTYDPIEPTIDLTLAMSLFFVMFGMSLAPKIAGVIDVALTPGEAKRYGGRGRFAAGVAIETLFGILLAPAVALRIAIFMVGLPFGRKIGWNGQVRDAYGLAWRTAFASLWPQMALGFALAALIWWGNPMVLPWAAPVLAGLILAAPFAVTTASPALGRWMTKAGLAGVPEEFETPEILRAVAAARPEEGLGDRATRPVDLAPIGQIPRVIAAE